MTHIDTIWWHVSSPPFQCRVLRHFFVPMPFDLPSTHGTRLSTCSYPSTRLFTCLYPITRLCTRLYPSTRLCIPVQDSWPACYPVHDLWPACVPVQDLCHDVQKDTAEWFVSCHFHGSCPVSGLEKFEGFFLIFLKEMDFQESCPVSEGGGHDPFT